MCVLVVAGAAQFAALAQMQDNAPVILVVAAALTVNLRMAMYSASIAPHLNGSPLWQRAVAAYILVDNAYAVGISEFDNRPNLTTSQKSDLLFWVCLACLVHLVWFDIFGGLSRAIDSARICARLCSPNRISRNRCTDAEISCACWCGADFNCRCVSIVIPALFNRSIYCGSGSHGGWRRN